MNTSEILDDFRIGKSRLDLLERFLREFEYDHEVDCTQLVALHEKLAQEYETELNRMLVDFVRTHKPIEIFQFYPLLTKEMKWRFTTRKAARE